MEHDEVSAALNEDLRTDRTVVHELPCTIPICYIARIPSMRQVLSLLHSVRRRRHMRVLDKSHSRVDLCLCWFLPGTLREPRTQDAHDTRLHLWRCRGQSASKLVRLGTGERWHRRARRCLRELRAEVHLILFRSAVRLADGVLGMRSSSRRGGLSPRRVAHACRRTEQLQRRQTGCRVMAYSSMRHSVWRH